MSAIIGYANLAMRDEVPESTRDYMRKTETSSRHLLELINDVHKMSRIESGGLELGPAPINICHVLDETYVVFQHQMDQKGIDFSVHTAQVHHAHVWCDRNSLNRVPLNPLGNVYRFHARRRHDLGGHRHRKRLRRL